MTLKVRGRASRVAVVAVLGPETIEALSGALAAIAPLQFVQRITGLSGRVTRILVTTAPGQRDAVRRELTALAGGRLTVAPADQDVSLLEQALTPNAEAMLSPAALAALKSHSWPGNVRELRNVLQRAMVFYEPETLEPAHLRLPATRNLQPLPMPLMTASAAERPARPPAETPSAASAAPPSAAFQTPPAQAPAAAAESTNARLEGDGNIRLPEHGLNLDTLEKSLLIQALEKTHNNQTRAAQLLGITRHTLRYRLEKHGLVEVDAEATAPAAH